MTIEYQSLESVAPFQKLQALLISKEKAGKSWLAATAPKPVLFLDTDLRAGSLAGKHGVYAATLRDPAPHLQPTAFNEILDLLTKLEKGCTLADLNPGWPALKPATIVDDSVTTTARAASRFALYTNTDIRRRLSFGNWSVDFAKNFDAWNAEMSTIESLILRCLALPYHFIATIHEAEEESEDSQPEKKKFTGKIGVFPARYQLLLKYFNDVWHLENAPDMDNPASQIYKPRVQVKPDYRCPWCVTTLDLAEQYQKPDIAGMLAKHNANVVPKLPAPAKVATATSSTN
jgi:AAA domain